jgi:hypothetical protein
MNGLYLSERGREIVKGEVPVVHFEGMFSLASECSPKKGMDIPYVLMLKGSNVMKGFFK